MTAIKSFAVILTEEFASGLGLLLQGMLHESLMPDQPKHRFLICSDVDISLGPWVSVRAREPSSDRPDIHLFLRHSDVALVFELTDPRIPFGFLGQDGGLG